MRHRTEWEVHTPTKHEQRPLARQDLYVHGFGYERSIAVDGVDGAPRAEAGKEDPVEVAPGDRGDDNVWLQGPDQLVPKSRAPSRRDARSWFFSPPQVGSVASGDKMSVCRAVLGKPS